MKQSEKNYFITCGNSLTNEYSRFKISEKYAKSKFADYIKHLQENEYVSLNETYISFDGNIEQGKCIDYYAK